jgi:hypothetical protein
LITSMLATLDIRKARDERGVEIEPVVRFENAVFRCAFTWGLAVFWVVGPARSEATLFFAFVYVFCIMILRHTLFLLPFHSFFSLSFSFHLPHLHLSTHQAIVHHLSPSYRTPSPFVCDIRPRSEEALKLIMDEE